MPDPVQAPSEAPPASEDAELARETRKQEVRESNEYKMIMAIVEKLGGHLAVFLESDLPLTERQAEQYVAEFRKELPWFQDFPVREALRAYLEQNMEKLPVSADRIESVMRALVPAGTDGDGRPPLAGTA